MAQPGRVPGPAQGRGGRSARLPGGQGERSDERSRLGRVHPGQDQHRHGTAGPPSACRVSWAGCRQVMRRCYVCFMSRRRLPMIVIAGVLFLVVSGATLVWRRVEFGWTAFGSTTSDPPAPGVIVLDGLNVVRSEERRVGREVRGGP